MSTRTTISGETPGGSYVEWAPIIGGSVLACAVSLVLVQFGNGIGFSVMDIRNRQTLTGGHLLIVGLWLLWVQLMASMAGGYLAGRMRAPWSGASDQESEIRDGAHGLLVWALSSLLAAIAAAVVGVLTVMAAHYGVTADTAPDVRMPADMARKVNIILGFGAVAASVVSAIAAWGMGVKGGDHRDNNADATRYLFFRSARTIQKR